MALVSYKLTDNFSIRKARTGSIVMKFLVPLILNNSINGHSIASLRPSVKTEKKSLQISRTAYLKTLFWTACVGVPDNKKAKSVFLQSVKHNTGALFLYLIEFQVCQISCIFMHEW